MAELTANLDQAETLVVLVVGLWIGFALWATLRPRSRVAQYSAICVTILAIAFALGHAKSPASEPIAPGPVSVGPSCTLVGLEMTAAEVSKTLGEPDQKISDEDVRGPAAEHWIYSSAGCNVHFQDGLVRAVD